MALLILQGLAAASACSGCASLPPSATCNSGTTSAGQLGGSLGKWEVIPANLYLWDVLNICNSTLLVQGDLAIFPNATLVLSVTEPALSDVAHIRAGPLSVPSYPS